MGFIVDLILIAVVVISAYIGWKKGLLRSVMKLVSVIAAAAGAKLLYKEIGTFLDNNIIGPKVSGYIFNSFNNMAEGSSVQTLFEKLPERFTEWVNTYGNMASVKDWYTNTKDATAKGLSNAIARPISGAISSAVAFALLFIIIFVIVRLICRIAQKLLKRTLLGTFNRILGLILGIVIGICLSWVTAELISICLPELGKIKPLFAFDPDSSTLLTLLLRYDPVTLIKAIKN